MLSTLPRQGRIYTYTGRLLAILRKLLFNTTVGCINSDTDTDNSKQS